MMNKTYEEMTRGELWKEITTLVDATNFTEIDKKTFIKLIEEYSFRK